MASNGLRRTIAVSLAAGLFLASAPAMANVPTYNVNNQRLSFFALGDGDAEIFAGANTETEPFRYENVITISGKRVDALVTLVDLSNSSFENEDGDTVPNTLDRLDKTNEISTEEQANELETTFRNSSDEENIEGYVVADIQFVAGGTSNPVRLTNVALSVSDIDNNQFAEFSGLSSYKLSPLLDVQDNDSVQPVNVGSQVSALTGSTTITTSRNETINVAVPAGSVRFFASETSSRYGDGAEDKSEDLFVIQALFSEVSTIRVKFGSFEMGSASLDFLFEPYENFGSVTPVAVTRPSATVSYDVNTGTGTAPTATSGSESLTVAGSLTAPGITKSGFKFAGWNTRADGLGVTYAPGSTILPVADTTLYAVWDALNTSTPGEELADTGETADMLAMTALFAIMAGAVLFALGRRKRA